MALHLHDCDPLRSLPGTIYSTFNSLMLPPIHLRPQKHVYSIVYMLVHIFRYFTWYHDFQPLQQHNIYISVITQVYSIKPY